MQDQTGQRTGQWAGRRLGRFPLPPFGNRGRAWLRAEALWLGLAELVRRESDQGRLFLWSPVMMLLGIWAYFSLPREPGLPALLAAAGLSGAACIILARRGRSARALTVAALVFCGMAAAKLQTDRALAPRLEKPISARVIGLVERIEPAKRKRMRLSLRPQSIEGVAAALLPQRIRVSALQRGLALRAGDRISFLARLQPPSGPVMPGGYDFSFAAFFEGRGAGGYVMGEITLLERGAAGRPFRAWMADQVAQLRAALGLRIGESLAGPSGAVARALIVGERQAIPNAVVDDLRRSGLAHILAISGLHMALLTGTAFWLARALMAFSPLLALNYPIKKWAGGIAFAAGFLYFLISGASVATERAFIMVGVALVAVFCDRPALTLRSLAVAAFIVAVLSPHAVMGPSFQMSFLAVAALIGLAEWSAARAPPDTGGLRGRPLTGFGLLRRYFLALAATSLIAGASTSVLAAYHFHAIAPLGLLANLAAMPLVALVIMPAGFFACLLMPFGLDPPLFAVMGVGIELVVGIAGFVADLSDGGDRVGLVPVLTPLFCTLGILWMVLWQTGLRWAGAASIAAGLAAAPFGGHPDVLISQSGAAMLVRQTGGGIAILRGRGNGLETKIWLASFGDGRSPRDKSLDAGFACDTDGCTLRPDGRARAPPGRASGAAIYAVARTRQAFLEDCFRADLLVSRLEAPAHCPKPGLVFDGPRLAKTGAVALTLRQDGGYDVQTARPEFPRPWHAPNAFLRNGRTVD